jgi:hypothetical protein
MKIDSIVFRLLGLNKGDSFVPIQALPPYATSEKKKKKKKGGLPRRLLSKVN